MVERLIESNPAAGHKIIEDNAMNFSNYNYRILYAEDNEDSRDLVRIMCEMSGIEVVKKRNYVFTKLNL